MATALTKFEACGKQVLAKQLGGYQPYADACSELAAQTIAVALNALPRDQRPGFRK